jgi:hypothetical protein
VTATDGDLATSSTITHAPFNGDYVQVFVNGLKASVGDGVKTGVECYFSANGGSTAKAFASITAGDSLYWNGSVAGYQLATTDVLDFCYEA